MTVPCFQSSEQAPAGGCRQESLLETFQQDKRLIAEIETVSNLLKELGHTRETVGRIHKNIIEVAVEQPIKYSERVALKDLKSSRQSAGREVAPDQAGSFGALVIEHDVAGAATQSFQSDGTGTRKQFQPAGTDDFLP